MLKLVVMKRRIFLLALLTALVVAGFIPIGAFESVGFHLLVDFTDAKQAQANAEWTRAEDFNSNRECLGDDYKNWAAHHTEILTRPLAIGTDWRPAIAAGVSLKLTPEPQFCIAYVRYSPDRKHWSTWQRLEENEHKQEDGFLSFHGEIGVAKRDSERYNNLLDKYRRLDVPWGDDEAAAVLWIVRLQPNFFAENLPFVGYLQFLCEVSIPSGRRLRSLEAEVSGGVSGLEGSPAKDPTGHARRDSKPWSYVSP